jgi:hypothetical protein
VIDEHSSDRTGWARFSDDRVHRYRLRRLVSSHATAIGYEPHLVRVVFVMLNPSTADAFKVDPTISKCCQFAKLWGADVLEVVNLFSFRSPHPKVLKAAEHRGCGLTNDEAILEAVTGADRVVAAWGAGGELGGRAKVVRDMLLDHGHRLEHLGLTQDGHPKHPLARGRHLIPLTQKPAVLA